MSVISDYLARKLIYENHPARRDAGCLNTLQTRQPCRLCADICPEGVFDHDPPAWERCSDCELCTAVCPTRCLSSSQSHLRSLLALFSDHHPDLLLSCTRQTVSADHKMPCLAAYPIELAAVFALTGTLTFLYGDCKNCPHSDHLQQFHEMITALRQFFMEDWFQKHIILTDDPSKAPKRNYSRREALQFLFSKTRQTAGSLIPSMDDLSPDGSIWRQLLVQCLLSMEHPPVCTWDIPSFTTSCSACGICTRLCPSGALHRLADEEQKDTWYLALIPWRCTGCGLCKDICPDEGMTAPKPYACADPTSPVLHRVHAASCVRCGEPSGMISSEGLCPRCQGKPPENLHF